MIVQTPGSVLKRRGREMPSRGGGEEKTPFNWVKKEAGSEKGGKKKGRFSGPRLNKDC